MYLCILHLSSQQASHKTLSGPTITTNMNRPEKRQDRDRISTCTHLLGAFAQNLCQFLKEVWLSILLVVVVGGITIGVSQVR